MVSKFIGILNLTPDSFSDGGLYNHPGEALSRCQKLINDGADIIDVGAESTRPGALILKPEEEWARLSEILPAIKNLTKKQQKSIEISLDSRNAQTIARALELGIDIINDVSGFCDPEIIKLAAVSGKKIIAMHNLGVPADKNKILPPDCDIVGTIQNWMKKKAAQLIKSGIAREQIIFDPGVGFGKNAAGSIVIIKNAAKFRKLGFPVLIGHSRKSFLDQLTNFSQENNFSAMNRDQKTAIISAYLSRENIDYLRLHDVAASKNQLF